MKIRTTAMGVVLAALSLALFAAPAIQAQTHPVPSRVTEKVDDARTVQLKGNIHPMARPEFDRGAVADSQPMTRMLLTLQRSGEQETALQQLMDAQQTKGSASYHAWLTPEQFGKQFGPSDADVQAVTDWLTRQGFQVAKVAAGRTTIEFSGNVSQVRNAFHTEIHKFAVNGEEHIANVSDPAIPAALAAAVKGIVALHNFPMRAHVQNRGVYRLQRDNGVLKPLFTFGNPANFALAPADFAKIYNIPNYNVTAGVNDGTGVTIAIVGQSNINAQDVIDFRNLFGLPQNFTQANNVILNGPDPGLQLATGDEGESILDVEWAGAVAPGAKILLVSTANTQSNPTQIINGVDLSAVYIVDNNLGSILSESYGMCEPGLTAAQNQFFNVLWQQAAAQGISVVVSSGDNGPAGCDPDLLPNVATDGLAVSGIASTPYNTAVGGTDFDPSAEPVTPPNQFWNATNGLTNGSALKYIPETTWDDSSCAFNFPAACTNPDNSVSITDISAASGGPSNCALQSGNKCSGGYAIPPYQIGFNTQFPLVRTIPDISLFASNGGPFPPTPFSGVANIVCESDVNPNGASCNLNTPFTDFSLVGGTSAATPPFAAIVALLSQSLGGQRLGNVNYGLYAAAANDTQNNYKAGACSSSLNQTPGATCVFNDVTKGNIGVACAQNNKSVVDGTTTWCNGIGASFGVTFSNGGVAFPATQGYDLATGLGSINVTNLLARWAALTPRTVTTTTVSNPSGGTPSGAVFSATVKVTPSTATGNVSLLAVAADQTTVLGAIGGLTNNGTTTPFRLSAGSANIQTNLLPPGTAFVKASYSGDASDAGSLSAAVAVVGGPVAGANFGSKTALNFITFDNNGNPVPTNQPQTVAYGSPYILAAIVSKSDGTNCAFTYPATNTPIPCPKGTIALADNGQPLKDFPSGPQLNATQIAKLSNEGGLVEDANVQLPGGAHSIQATYASSDSNYQGSTSNALSVTITTAQTLTAVIGTVSGTTGTFQAQVSSQSNSTQGPTGNVQFFNGSTSLGTVPCTPSGAVFGGGGLAAGASCTATLSNVSVAALYPPTTPEPRGRLPLLPILFALLSIVLFGLGWRWMPEKRRRTYAYAGFVAFALLAVGISGCGGGGGGGGHNVTIKASYVGDTNYGASSGTTNITVQ
ncbi:MAG TPA: protease pro-enzyme activation domain-containing protein [Candidatus Baltobacteraceae bacterium]|nr:protease pro-enzyme activation domain-containing protein [Candidatus Baltobacteraceae bacterium]